MSRLTVCAVCSVMAAASLAGRCSAEVFILKSGGRIEGEYLNPTRQRGEPFQLRTEEGVRLLLADNTVARVIVKTDLDKQYEALAAKAENSVEGQWNMAEWCKEAGLIE